MHLVYITEPAWFETAIPNWVQAGLHTVVTESDSVVNEAVMREIEVLTPGKYFPYEKACELVQGSIEQERSLRKKLGVMLYPDAYLSEMIRGISDLTYACGRYMYMLGSLLERCSPCDVIFVYGDRYRASVDETPRGGLLEYLFLSRGCRDRGIRMQVRAHGFMSKRGMARSTRYDRYLSGASVCSDIKAVHNNLREMPLIKQENALFLYMYEMCKDDLEALAIPEKWPENCGILTGRLSKFAPKSICYDFDFSNAVAMDGKSYGKSFRKLKKSIDSVLGEFFLVNFGKFPSAQELIKYQTRRLEADYNNCCLIIESLKKVISKYKIKHVVLTGYKGQLGTTIASCLAAQSVGVTVRQHGVMGETYWPDKCAVEGCYFSAISDFYKKNITANVLGSSVLPRERKCSISFNKTKEISASKYILVTDDLFLNPTNKMLHIRFFTEFVGAMPSEWSIVLRRHPRYPGDLIPGLSTPRIIREDSRQKDIISSLKSACVLVSPIDNFSTVGCDAIMAGVPPVVVAPEGWVNVFNFKPYAFGYPMIVSQPVELINIISRIKSDPAYVKEILSELNAWIETVLGKSEEVCDMAKKNSYSLNQAAITLNVSSVKYIKMLCRTKIKLLVNRWHIRLSSPAV